MKTKLPKRERMSSVDTAWLRMDSPHNLMMIVGVLDLERVSSRGCAGPSRRASSLTAAGASSGAGGFRQRTPRLTSAHLQRSRCPPRARANLSASCAIVGPLDALGPLAVHRWNLHQALVVGSTIARRRHCADRRDALSLSRMPLLAGRCYPDRGGEEEFARRAFEPLTDVAMKAIRFSEMPGRSMWTWSRIEQTVDLQARRGPRNGSGAAIHARRYATFKGDPAVEAWPAGAAGHGRRQGARLLGE